MFYSIISQPYVLATYSRGGSSSGFSVTLAPTKSRVGPRGLIVWRVGEASSNGGTASDAVYLQRVGELGELVGTSVLVTARNWSQIAPAVRYAWMSSDRFVVVWVARAASAGGTSDGGPTGIIAQVYGADGTPDGAPIVVSTDNVPDGPLIDVTGVRENGFVVVWSNGTSVKTVKVDAAGVVKTPIVMDTPASAPLCVTIDVVRYTASIIVGWSYNDGGIRCFLQELYQQRMSTGGLYPPGEAIAPWTPTPYEVGSATAGNSEFWLTPEVNGEFFYVTRGEGSSYRTYRLSPGYEEGPIAPPYFGPSTGALWSGVSSLPSRPTFAYYNFYSGVSFMVPQLSTTDADGNPWPGGAARSHFLQINWETGLVRTRIDPPVGATSASPVGISIVQDWTGIFSPVVVEIASDALKIIAFVDPQKVAAPNDGGPVPLNQPQVIHGPYTETLGIFFLAAIEFRQLRNHPTASAAIAYSIQAEGATTNRVALLDAAGDIIFGPTDIGALATSNSRASAIIPTTDGGLIIRTAPTTLTRFDQTISTTGATLTVASDACDACVLSDGRLIVANPGGSLTINVYNGTTFSTISTGLVVDPGNPTNAGEAGNRVGYTVQFPRVIPLGNGGFAVVWFRQYDATFPSRYKRTWYRVYDASLNPVSAIKELPFGVNPVPTLAVQSGAFMDGSGFFQVQQDFDRTKHRITYIDNSGNIIRSFFWGGQNVVYVNPWNKTVSGINYGSSTPFICYTYTADGVKMGEDALAFHTSDTNFQLEWSDGGFTAENRIFLLMAHNDFSSGVQDQYYVRTQLLTTTGNTPAASVAGLETYKPNPFITATDDLYPSYYAFEARGDGGAVVAHAVIETIDGSDVTQGFAVQALNACCEPVGPPQVILEPDYANMTRQTVAGLPNGDMVYAGGNDYTTYSGYFWRWTVQEPTGGGGPCDVGGGPAQVTLVQNKVKFHEATAENEFGERFDTIVYPRVAPRGGGGFVIAWTNGNRDLYTGSPPTTPIVRAKFYDSAGNEVASVVVDDRVSDDPENIALSVKVNPYTGPGIIVKRLSNGNTLIAWDVLNYNDYYYAASFFRIYTPAGVPVTGITPVYRGLAPSSSPGAWVEQLFDVELREGGGFRVMFFDFGGEQKYYDYPDTNAAMVREFDNSGNPLGAARETPMRTGSSSLLPDGSFLSLTGRLTTDAIEAYTIAMSPPLVQRWTQDGDVRTGSLLPLASASDAAYPNGYFATLSNGNVAVLWRTKVGTLAVQFVEVDDNGIPVCTGGVYSTNIRFIWIN